MKIKLYLDQTTNKTQGHPLRLAVYVSTKDRSYPFTSYYSTIEHWNTETEEPKKSHPQYIEIMDFLLEKRRTILQIQNSRESLTAKQAVSKIMGVGESAESIYSFWEIRIQEMKKAKKDGNATFYSSYLSAWKSYKSQILFSEIDYNFLTKFKIHKLQDISPNGVNVYLKAIQAIYNEAVKRGIHKPTSYVSPFTGIKEKATPTKDKYLTLEEMKVIASKEVDHDYYRYFMLQFYLGGLDFVDIANLKKEHIKKGRIYKQPIKIENYIIERHSTTYNKAKELILGQWVGEINYNARGVGVDESMSFKFWEPGNGLNFTTKNMMHNSNMTSTERVKYLNGINQNQEVWDTTLNKKLIFRNGNWYDMMGAQI